jgi:hypothetical protein
MVSPKASDEEAEVRGGLRTGGTAWGGVFENGTGFVWYIEVGLLGNAVWITKDHCLISND